MKKLILILVCSLLIINEQIFTKENNIPIKKVYIIPIKGEINKALMVFLKRNIESAKIEKADSIIFEIDTFGGRVDSALQITSIIGSCENIKTIAYISPQENNLGVSWSAGALISFSCSSIYMAEGTSIGAAAPVYQTQEGVEMAPEKIVSPLRTQMAALAEKNGYPKNIALAMVDKDMEIYEVYIDDKLQIVSKEELVNLEKKAKQGSIKFELGRTISPSGKLLTLTSNEMEYYGLSSGTVSSTNLLLKHLNIEDHKIVRIKENFIDKIILFLASMTVSSILIAIALISLYLEIRTPGFGIFGVTSIAAFLIIFSINALLGNVGSLEIVLFILGAILLIIEIFLIPGFGITGISGIVLISLSLILSFQDFIIPSFDWQWNIAKENLIILSLGIMISIAVIAVSAQILPKTPIFNKLTLHTEQKAEDGFVVQPIGDRARLKGLLGITVTILRPTGKAMIQNEILEVQSDGEYIEKNQKIEIIDVTGNKIIVKKV
ncbi:MAG: nodulation protein NfeD [Spirochaetes bacterium]|nr:nodulation protein NfeD [Spirochaetota bacterium]